MKKILFASAFALIGTFAIANEIELGNEQFEIDYQLFDYFQCTGVKSDCGIALIYCWQGELDPDKLNEFRDKACAEKDIDEEQDGPESEG